MTDEEFRLPGSSYGELVKIIMAYAHHGKEAVPSEVGRLAGIHETIVSRNNGFLLAIGVVQGGKKKVVTPGGRRLGHALEHQILEEVSQAWRDLVIEHEFFRQVIAAVRIRRGMDESTLLAHVAYSAGQKKSAAIMAGAAAVVQILLHAGMLKSADGKVVAVDNDGANNPNVEVRMSAEEPAPVAAVSVPAFSPLASSQAVQVTVQLQIQCSASELDGLASKIRDLIREVTRVGEEPEAVKGE